MTSSRAKPLVRALAFTTVADSAPGMMWLAEPHGGRTFFNTTWLTFTGRTVAEESGVGWALGVHVDDRARCLAEYERGVRSGDRFQLEYRLRHADGDFRHVLDRAAPRVEKGALVGFIGSCLDIQDRKGAELALRASETHFRLLAENALDVIYRYRVHPAFSTEYISPAAAAICGRKPEEFLANPDLGFQLVHPDDRTVAMAMRVHPRDFEDSYRLRWLHPDGRVVWAEHRDRPVFDAEGRLVAIEGIGRDITDRVAAEQRLAESESLFRLLAENASDMIYRYALSPPRCEYMSPASTRITGYAPQEFYADQDLPWRLLHPDDRWALSRGREAPHEVADAIVVRWHHREGATIYVEHKNTPVYNNDGELVAIEGIGRDVTHRRAIDIQLRESESQLRRLAASVEQARENERTLIARELHDELGQSLTAIKLELARTAQALVRQRLAPEAIDSLQSIVGGIDVATETVRQLATSLRPPALDHLGLVAAIELEAAALTRRTGIRCRVAGNRQMPPLDPAQTTGTFRIVQEALTNVVRHASASAVTISIVGRAESTLVKIQDNGRGMTPDRAADRASLGLLGMRERADMIGGTLSITSTPGKSTSVSLVLHHPAAPRRKRRS